MGITRKTVVYLAVAYLFIGLGLAFKEPSISIFVIPIAAALLYSSLFSIDKHPQLEVKRTLNPPRSFGGESINITVAIQNTSSCRTDQLELEDHVPESLSLEAGTTSLILSLHAEERFEYEYTISAPRRGRYLLGPMKAHIVDDLGFSEFSETLLGQDELLILPKVEKLRSMELRARRVGPWSGSIASRNIGLGTEFYELRSYSPGDDLRRINWKASAKRGRLVANEFETERVTDVMLVLDCSEGALSELFAYDVEEYEVSLAASLCSQLLLQGNRVGLLVYSKERTWLAPAFGKRQLLRILSSLALVKGGPSIVPIAYAVESVTAAVLPARSIIVFVSPFLGDDIVEAVWNTANAGYNVLCFAPTESTIENESRYKSLARRILATERRMNLRQVFPVCRFIPVTPEKSVETMLRRIKPWRSF